VVKIADYIIQSQSIMGAVKTSDGLTFTKEISNYNKLYTKQLLYTVTTSNS